MLRLWTEALDRLAIRSACRSVRCGTIPPENIDEAQSMLERDGFFPAEVPAPIDLQFHGGRGFRFTSHVTTPFAGNNIVHGKLFRAGTNWPAKPSILLVHGWNGELGYRYQFPFVARLLNRFGINAAMIELPYHAQRRPQAAGAINNFISHDLVRMLEATRQAMSDLRAMLAWLRAQGSPALGMWGVSLGAWLTGLVSGTDPQVRLAVFMSPVVSLDRAIRELAFCAPIRHSLGDRKFSVAPLNLANHKPRCGPEQALLIQSTYDLFAPTETVEEVWQAWDRPEIWRLPQGHISVLASVPTTYRVSRWIARKVT